MSTSRSIRSLAFVLAILGAAHAQAQTIVNYNSTGVFDLSGTFVYALDIGGNDGPLTLGAITFRDDDNPNPPGVLTASSDNNDFSYQSPTYVGADAANLQAISNSIRWDSDGSGLGDVSIDLAVKAGEKYKLQLFWQDDASGNRGTDIMIDGGLLFNDLAMSTGSTSIGKLLTYEFIAPDGVLNIDFDGTATAGFADRNAILSGLTLELLTPEPATWVMAVVGVLMLPLGLKVARRRRS